MFDYFNGTAMFVLHKSKKKLYWELTNQKTQIKLSEDYIISLDAASKHTGITLAPLSSLDPSVYIEVQFHDKSSTERLKQLEKFLKKAIINPEMIKYVLVESPYGGSEKTFKMLDAVEKQVLKVYRHCKARRILPPVWQSTLVTKKKVTKEDIQKAIGKIPYYEDIIDLIITRDSDIIDSVGILEGFKRLEFPKGFGQRYLNTTMGKKSFGTPSFIPLSSSDERIVDPNIEILGLSPSHHINRNLEFLSSYATECNRRTFILDLRGASKMIRSSLILMTNNVNFVGEEFSPFVLVTI